MYHFKQVATIESLSVDNHESFREAGYDELTAKKFTFRITG